ncbi:hypothetical protein [Aurantiacibacter gilvus]|uniref:Ribosomal protein L7/L12 C-terminal domain-containing protein n=1 Tax=Aurantiacibacter gilvus TaxID=3139141 RepID=A0ABU9IER1_9SPHN
MFVPLWLLVGMVAVIVLLAGALIRKGSADDMISRQRRDAPPARTVDEAALLALPEVAEALERGNRIEAIRHIRLASGLGLKASKDLVERHTRR